MARYLLILLAVIWIAGLCFLFLAVGVFGAERIQSVLPLWIVLPIPLLFVWRTIEFFIGIKDGYTEGEEGYRRLTNRCAECGYSLRGNVSKVCPECGNPVHAPIGSAAGASHPTK